MVNLPTLHHFGSEFFTIYASPISKIAQRHGVHVHLHVYADDTQLYLNNTQDQLSAKVRMELCILEIKSWMDANKLKLTDTKTEFITLSSKYQQSKIQVNEIQVANTWINASTCTSVRNLGVMFDNTLSMDTHVKNICQSVYFQIRNVRSMRKVPVFSNLQNKHGGPPCFNCLPPCLKSCRHALKSCRQVLKCWCCVYSNARICADIEITVVNYVL